MNEIIKENKNIEDMIYEVRGVQVMLDSDLAKFKKLPISVNNKNYSIFYINETSSAKNNKRNA